MDVDRYLERIGYDGPRDPSLETLRALHWAHLLAVPFENLSIHRGEAIQLEERWLYEKIVHRRRGGFCYELNGLFVALLRALGFRADRLAARVFDEHGMPGIPFDHMALRVRLDRDWLVDVGFGDCFIEPLPLEPGTWTDVRRRYRLRAAGSELALYEEREGRFAPQYLLSPSPHELADFAPGCRHHQVSPRSHFTRRRVCTRLTEAGRLSLSDGKYVVTRADGSRAEEAIDEKAFHHLLARDFGIDPRLDPPA